MATKKPVNKGDHGTTETVIKGGVRVNKDGASDENGSEENGVEKDFSRMTKSQLREALSDANVEFDADASKADLVGLAEDNLL